MEISFADYLKQITIDLNFEGVTQACWFFVSFDNSGILLYEH